MVAKGKGVGEGWTGIQGLVDAITYRIDKQKGSTVQ